jgi:hypothetical protein
VISGKKYGMNGKNGIKNHPNKTKRVAKPKFSNMKAKDI